MHLRQHTQPYDCIYLSQLEVLSCFRIYPLIIYEQYKTNISSKLYSIRTNVWKYRSIDFYLIISIKTNDTVSVSRLTSPRLHYLARKSFWLWAQPMRDDITYREWSLIYLKLRLQVQVCKDCCAMNAVKHLPLCFIMTSYHGNGFHITGLCKGNPLVNEIRSQMASNEELWCFHWTICWIPVELSEICYRSRHSACWWPRTVSQVRVMAGYV